MAPFWRDQAFGSLQEGIARIRRLVQQVEQAHELVAANTQLLERDRQLVRAGALQEFHDLRTHESQLREAEPEKGRRSVRSRRRR